MNKLTAIYLAKFILKIATVPLLFLAAIYLSDFALSFLPDKYMDPELKAKFSFYLNDTVPILAIYWVCVNFLNTGITKVIEWASTRNHPLLLILIPPIRSSLQGALLLMTINMTLTSLQFNGVIGVFFDKLSKVLLIITIAWIFYKIISSLEQYITNRFITQNENVSISRKIQTQISILRRVVGFFIAVITFAAIIMVFDSLRSIGTSLLTTAGIISAIGAFASQQSLGRIFAGLQLAFTQPIRIGDTVIIEHEFGQVEDITLSFITVKLWDLRRLILPTDYFIQKGVLNLTLQSSELLGTIFLYADYTLPVENVRKEFLELITQSTLWNKKVAELEVTDFKEHTMEIRCLISADNAGDLWKLRCQLRESLIQYIVDNHYDCLSKSRTVSLTKPIDETA